MPESTTTIASPSKENKLTTIHIADQFIFKEAK